MSNSSVFAISLCVIFIIYGALAIYELSLIFELKYLYIAASKFASSNLKVSIAVDPVEILKVIFVPSAGPP